MKARNSLSQRPMLLVILGLMAACGGGSGARAGNATSPGTAAFAENSPPAPGGSLAPPADAALLGAIDDPGVAAVGARVPKGGLWRGKTAVPWPPPVPGSPPPAKTDDALALIAEDGRAYFVLGDFMYWGHVYFHAGSNFIDGIVKGARLQGSPPVSSRYLGMRRLYGNILKRRSIDAHWCGILSVDPDLCISTFRISLPYQSSYDANSSLAQVAGIYAESHGRLGGVLSIASNGDLFLQDPATGCVLNGRIAIIDREFNAYDVGFTYSNCRDAKLNRTVFSGLATYRGQARELVVIGSLPVNMYSFTRR